MTRTRLLAVLALAMTLLFSVVGVSHAAGYYSSITMPPIAAGLGEPSDLVVALDGEVFVADSANGRIAVLAGGQVVRDWDGSQGLGPELRRPTGISLGPDDLLYVADALADAVVVYERDGDFVRVIGSAGAANGQLSGPSDVIADATGVWVADTFNDRVQRFTLTGGWVRTVGGGASALFGQPVSLDLYNGLVYVSESVGLRGQAFNATTGGVAIAPWGITDSGGGLYVSRYLRPAGIDVDANARLLLVDGGRGVVEQMNSAASVVATLALGGTGVGLSQPAGVVSTGDTVMVADTLNDRIARYSFLAAAWTAPIAPTGSSAAGAFLAPAGGAVLPGGGFVVTDSGNDRVERFDAAGAFVSAFATAGVAAVDAPAGVVVAAGEVFVADRGNHRIQVYDTTGTHLRTIAGPGSGDGQLSSPTGLAVDPGGNILVADTGNNRVQRLTTTGAHLQTIGPLSAPRGVAVTAAGTIFVADTGGHRIRSFSAAGVAGPSWGTFGSGNSQFASPEGVAVDPVSGEVVVADTGNHRIQVFAANGTFTAAMGGRGTATDELRSPRSVSIDASRGMLIADTGNHRIQRVGYDAASPVTSADGVGPTWVNHPVTVTLTATDNGAGVATTFYRVGSGADTTYTAPFTVSAQGTTNVRYWSVDRAGNVELVKTGQVRIDSLPPTGTMTLAGGASIVGTRTVSVDSTVADAFTMSVDTGSGFGARIDYAPSVNVVVPADGLRTVNVRYYDFLENMLTLSDSVTVDGSGPLVELTRSPVTAVTSQAVDVTLLASDALSGVSQRFLAVDSFAEQPYVAPVTVDTEGTHTVVGRAVDGFGNSSTTSSSFAIDRTGPDVAVGGITDGEIFSAGATFSLSASDTLSSVATARYRIDGGAATAYTTYVTVAGEGTHSLSADAVDAVGNVGATKVVEFLVDLTAPTVTATGAAPGSVRTDDATITLTASDALSGLASVRYRVDGGAWNDYAVPFAVTGDGVHVVQYEARDRAGHVTAPAPLTFTILGIAPAGTLVVGDGSPYTADPAVVLRSEVSGAESMRFDLGMGFGPWVPYAATHDATLPGEGTYTIIGEYTNAGGLSVTIPTALTVDQTPPTVAASGVASGSVNAGGVTITLAAADQLSGVASVRYRIDGGAWVDYSEPFTVTGEGAHTVEYEARDGAGHVSVPGSLAFSIDSQVPAGSLVAGDGSPFSAHNDVVLNSSVTGASLMRFDVGWGFGPWMPYAPTHAVTLPGDGAYVIVGEYRGANGLSTRMQTALTVDMTAPVVMSARLVPRSIAGSGASMTTRLVGSWSATDPGLSPSGIVRHSASLAGISYLPSSPSVEFAALGVGTHMLRTGATDGAGNISPGADSVVTIGSLPAPKAVVASTRRVAGISVAGVGPAAGERVSFRCFRRGTDGRWTLAFTARARRLDTQGGPMYRSTVRLRPGMWRVCVESSGANTYRLGTPSAAFTVR